MLTNNILFTYFSKIVLFWLIMYFLILIISYIQKKENKKLNIKEIKDSRISALIYLDQFYITNRFYTFFMIFIYSFGMFIIFIFLRYLNIGNIVQVLPKENTYLYFLPIVLIYSIIIVTIILYKTLLILIFKKEINKFFIYFRSSSWYYNLYKFLNFKLSLYFFGSLYVITYRIATLKFKENMYPLDSMEDLYKLNFDCEESFYILDEEIDYALENKRLIQLAYSVQNLCKDFKLMRILFIILAYIFRFLIKHLPRTWEFLPYFILVVTFFMDLYNKEFSHIYLISFIILIIKLKRDLMEFINDRDFSERYLSEYFYENTVDYKLQRTYFYNNDNISIMKLVNSLQNNELSRNLNRVIDFASNDFKEKTTYDPEKNKHKGIYKRFLFITAIIFMTYYLWFKSNLQIDLVVIIFLIISIIAMIYFHINIFYPIKYEERIEFELCGDYIYNRKYNIIFWIFALIHLYLYYILLLQPEITFIQNEVLIDNYVKITKIYTIEEKILYLYQYFEYYLSLINNLNIDKDYLRYMIRQIDYNILIDDNIKLKDIQVYIKLLIDNYVSIEAFEKICMNKIIEGVEKEYYDGLTAFIYSWCIIIFGMSLEAMRWLSNATFKITKVLLDNKPYKFNLGISLETALENLVTKIYEAIKNLFW